MSDPTRAYPPDPNQDTRTSAPGAGAAVAGEIVAPTGYELHEELGRGGMGVVFRARDLDLGREVAVKILQPHYAPNSSSGNRFVEEARITGRLQHPGIPAIYRVGKLPDGRPFLAMKLINGQTLEEKLKERSNVVNETGMGLTPFEQAAHGMLDRLDAVLRRGRFLAVFEQVAQAVGYAHKEGVIHRDLKPSNVMVGAFGEVQVMDWGLAKYSERKPAVPVRTDGDSVGTVEYTPDPAFGGLRGDVTLAGSVLGTPAYMPPEQAIGAIDKIGKPSDVFGLGAILCVILTGEPPYVAESVETARQLAARAKQEDAFARLDASGAEPELIALAKRCLAPEPSDRPRDAGEVATAVAALRAESEQRARQAEMDRARAEVKTSEERKRRRVQRALAFSILGLLAVAGGAAWWIDSVRSQRAADLQADELRHITDSKVRLVELRTRQLVTERDVLAALNEVQILREQGIKQADDPARWALTLNNANSAYKRAQGLLAAGEPTDSVVLKVAAAKRELDADERDRTLLAELDRIADGNEIRLMIPVSFSSVTSRQYASAFRANGIDLTDGTLAEAVAWLKGHRFRDRLGVAIRSWRFSLPATDLGGATYSTEFYLLQTAPVAIAGGPAMVGIIYKPTLASRLDNILEAVTSNPFAKEWWNAVANSDLATLKQLIARPEMRQLSAREMSSLADGLNVESKGYLVLDDFLGLALERFPGEFWVHIRLAFHPQMATPGEQDPKIKAQKDAESIRHLTAAIAARPNSAIARATLGMIMLEKKRDDPAGLRMIHGAAEVDPTSPWPHLFLGIFSMEQGNWTEALSAFKHCVRADPDTGFFMVSSMISFRFNNWPRGPNQPKEPTDAEIETFIAGLIAARPDHPGGYHLLAQHQLAKGDARAALASLRKASSVPAPDYSGRILISTQIQQLETLAKWESKLPAVLRGEIKLTDHQETVELAEYCAAFDRKYALAARFASEAVKAEPVLLDIWVNAGKFAGYAIQAGFGNGADAGNLTPAERRALRKQALAWLRESVKRSRKSEVTSILGDYFYSLTDLEPVRESKQRAKLPTDEQDEWIAFWLEIAPRISEPVPKGDEITPAIAPPPREVKQP